MLALIIAKSGVEKNARISMGRPHGVWLLCTEKGLVVQSPN